MTKIDHRMIFGLAVAFMVMVTVKAPWILGDSNNFLEGFVNHEFLNFMGIVVTITLASTASLHIELKKLEKEAGKEFLVRTKRAVRNSAYSLICAMLLSVVLVVVKPLLPSSETAAAFANSCALALILWGVSVIYDITRLAFKL